MVGESNEKQMARLRGQFQVTPGAPTGMGARDRAPREPRPGVRDRGSALASAAREMKPLQSPIEGDAEPRAGAVSPRPSRPSVGSAMSMWRGRAALLSIPAWLPLVAMAAAIGGRRWWQHGAYVTGLDGGSWFAFGQSLVGEEGGKPTPGAYPPLVPLLMAAGRAVADPMTVAKAVGIGSLMLVMVATYVVARGRMNRGFAVATAATVGLAGFFTESMIFGGYPQNVAFALMVVGAYGVARYVGGGGRRDQVGAGAALAGVALSHHTIFGVAGLVVVLVWGMWLTTRPGRRAAMDRTVGLGFVAVIAVACFAPTLLALRRYGYEPPINANELDVAGGLRYAIREAPWIWGTVFLMGALVLGSTHRGRRGPVWQTAAALMAASLLLLPVTAEPRTVAPGIVGASLGLRLGWQRAWERIEKWWRVMVPFAAAMLPVVLGARLEAVTPAWYDYYRVIDGPLLETAAFVDEGFTGRTVVVREDRRGWAMGWWFEGLTGAEVIVGSHERWLAFPGERANARLADAFFAHGKSTAEVATLASREGVELLVFRKWEWIGWTTWLDEPRPMVAVVYDDGTFMALRLGGGDR